jgi:glycine C-acetyltransferase
MISRTREGAATSLLQFCFEGATFPTSRRATVSPRIDQDLLRELEGLREQNLYKTERLIAGPQGPVVRLEDGREVINLCANNYLGLAQHPAVLAAAHAALDRFGYGMASVRFICGTQTVHRELEKALADFLGTEDAILYGSCFDANGGIFETLLDERDAVVSDALNHASIIDGIRLCKARRYRFANGDLGELEERLKEARDARRRLIVTDGVFSMDGYVARLAEMRALADRYDALLMVDDSHGVGVLGAGGRGSHEARGLVGKIDVLSGTLGKALGGASGGYIASSAAVVDWLRQRSRPYLFSNTLAPPIAAASLIALEIVRQEPERRERLLANARRLREDLVAHGFDVLPGEHPIVPVMMGTAERAQRFAARLLDEGIYAVGFFYPVVPEGRARIRLQVSAAHSREHLDRAVSTFARLASELAPERKEVR